VVIQDECLHPWHDQRRQRVHCEVSHDDLQVQPADEELEALGDAGAVLIRLGPTVLRTSTAAAVALGALGVLTSRWC
ncbi:MAG: 16S rRNA (uracil(1498)-N(3))-methyltransferase, partial [Mycobacterium sp.]